MRFSFKTFVSNNQTTYHLFSLFLIFNQAAIPYEKTCTPFRCHYLDGFL